MYLPISILSIHLKKKKKKKRSAKESSNDDYGMFLYCFFSSSDFLYKRICRGYSIELHRQVDAVQMVTHNIYLYKAVDKKYTGCNLKTTELLDSALIGVCALIGQIWYI